MLFTEAQRTLQQFLAPLTLDEFLDRTLSGSFRKLDGAGAGAADRVALLGPDPRAVLAAAFQLAPRLTFHSANPLGSPPSLAGVTDADDFRARIAQFHARNYSVRFPELRPLSPALDHLARALEMLLQQPVTSSAFWSLGGMRAPVHYDDHDLLVVQLLGAKRWHVADSSQLPNTWAYAPAESLELGAHTSFDVQPGDLVYLPRGTVHSVDSTAESLHLSIGFTPLTLREALIAALDQLADADRTLRATVGGRLGYQVRGAGLERLTPLLLDGVERLRAACRTPGFLAAALQLRATRTVAALTPLPAPPPPPPVLGLDTELEQTAVAFCHLTARAGSIDFTYPGGHLYLHAGADQAVLYMVNTPRFRIRDIPGDLGEDVRVSLAARLVEVGFLKPV